MFKDKKFWLQPLWMAALTVPWGIGGFIAHTGFSLSAGLGAYWLLDWFFLSSSLSSRIKAMAQKWVPQEASSIFLCGSLLSSCRWLYSGTI